jgi:AraC-like DNA-binding protein
MGRIAETTPELLTNTNLSLDLGHDLSSAAEEFRSGQALSSDTVGRQHNRIVVDRFRAMVQEQGDWPSLSFQEISQKIGVSGRTLRLACREQLGASPFQYVMLRRMQAVRRALQKADPAIARVTDIASDHGFFELGRFAVNYRRVFGETPSATLKATAYLR